MKEKESNMKGYCGKGCLYFYNLIYLGISGVLMYMSVLFVRFWGDYASLLANSYALVPASIIFIFACIILVSGIIGMCGNCYENRCTLGVFLSLLIVVCICEIVGDTLVYVKDKDIKSSMESNLWQSFDNYYTDSAATRHVFDKMQRTMECCGVNATDDWSNASMEIPESCCIHPGGEKCYLLPDNLFQSGCWPKVEQSYSSNTRYITSVVLAFAVFQLCGIILTIYMLIVLKRRFDSYSRLMDPIVHKT